MLRLLVSKSYIVHENIDVLDGLVNVTIRTLRYVEQNIEVRVKRLWLIFDDMRTYFMSDAEHP